MANSLSNVNFRGGESIGSIGHKNNPPVECPTCGQVNFKGDSFEYSEPKKKNKGWKIALAALGAVALGIGGMGFAGRAVAKGTDSKIAKFFGDNKVGETCYKWCQTIKGWAGKLKFWGKNTEGGTTTGGGATPPAGS